VIPLFQSSAWAVTNKNVSGVVLDISENWRNWIVIPEFPISILIVLLIATLIPLILVRKLPRRQVIVN
jgi:hypothetical protein